MRGTWQSEDGGLGQLVAVLGGGAIIGAAVWLIVTFLWVIAIIVGVALAAAIAACSGWLGTAARWPRWPTRRSLRRSPSR